MPRSGFAEDNDYCVIPSSWRLRRRHTHTDQRVAELDGGPQLPLGIECNTNKALAWYLHLP